MSNLFWVTAIISSTVFSAAPDYSKLVKELDKVEVKAGKVQEQYDAMSNSIKSTNHAVLDLEKEISLKEQALTSKKIFARERIGALLKYSVPDKINFLNAFDNVQEAERDQVLLGKMLKKDAVDYNNLNTELGLMDELKKILNGEKQKLESKSKELSYYIIELKANIAQKKKLLQKLHSSQTGSKILAERSKQSANKISGIMSQGKDGHVTGNLEPLMQGFVPPIKGKIISVFGKVWDTYTRNWVYNKGVKVEAEYGKEVRSVDAGLVSYAGWIPGYGKVLIIKHDSGLFSVYGHLSRILLNKGAKVEKGIVVGYIGDTGSVDVPSLYFEISTSTQNMDPSSLFY